MQTSPTTDTPIAPRQPAGGDGKCVRVRAMLFDADGDDRLLAEEEIGRGPLGERQLLWVDVEEDDAGAAEAVLASLGERGDAVRLQNVGDWFLAQVVAVEHEGRLRFGGRALAILCGRNFVVSLHRGPLEFIEQLRDRERADTRIGALSAESFCASLLDWAVESYLRAVSDFEAAVDRLEVTLLASRVHRQCLPELAQLRRGASRLRRMLSPHRQVFGALARPDFRPSEDGVADRHFRALEQRFERAMDAVENTRELVVGSFELFTTRSAERTNETMRALTFVTVLLGSLAVVAGALGMNFKTPFFDTGDVGFWVSIGVMAGIAIVATSIARWRRWI
jgi:magnesium transporter